MVNGYSAEWLGKGFDWVYPAEIIARTGQTQSGAVVQIVTRDGRLMGVGVASEGQVAVRRFRCDAGPVDAAFIADRLAAARSRRHFGPETTAWRWVHGENDDLPGVRVDVWGPAATIAIDHPSLNFLIPWVIAAVVAEPGIETVWENARPEHDDDRETPQGGRCVAGDESEEPVVVREHGLQFSVQPRMGLDAGLYPDMRAVRAWLRPFWKGKRVLNTFGYTGAFSVAAAAGGAIRVDTVDLAPTAIARAKVNFDLNGLERKAHGFCIADTFSAIDHYRRAGDHFDIIIVDPPSFSHGEDGVWSIEKDLPRVVAGCLRILAPGGWILVATNQGSISPKAFQKLIKMASIKVSRRLRLIHQGTTPHDIPAAMHFPESRYLKAWVLEG
jgi:23S rRNA (cytosine1962-C5)-methyltransferase